MQYDTICLEDKCRIDRKQLFFSRDHDSQIHFDEQHAIQSISYSSRFLRSLKTGLIKFSQSLDQTLSQLQAQYRKSVELMKSALKANFEQCKRKLRDIYELNNKEFSFDMFEPHLKRGTFKTQFYLDIVNWKKGNPSKDLNKYIQNMPKACIKDSAKTMNSLIEPLLSNIPASSNNIYQKGGLYATKQTQPNLECNQKLIEQLSEPMPGSYDANLNLDQKSSLQNQPLKKKRTPKDQQILMELAEVFCTSLWELRYSDIEQPLRKKLSTRIMFHSYYQSLMSKICLKIESYIVEDFGFKRMRKLDRARILTDLKNYRDWMEIKEKDIFIRCVRFFMNLDQGIEISKYEIYVIYILIMIRIIQKMSDKDIKLPYNTSPKDLKREIFYLYLHYQNYIKVKEILIARYPNFKNLIDGYMKRTLKVIMIHIYNQLKERESIENERFQRVINEETDFSGESWSPIVRRYIEYLIHRKVDNSERIELRNIMRVIAFNQQNKERIQVQEQQPIKRTIYKFKDHPLGMNCKEGRSWQILQFQKIIENEEMSNSGSQVELDQESSDD